MNIKLMNRIISLQPPIETMPRHENPMNHKHLKDNMFATNEYCIQNK